jgi:hypothetical protein
MNQRTLNDRSAKTRRPKDGTTADIGGVRSVLLLDPHSAKLPDGTMLTLPAGTIISELQ